MYLLDTNVLSEIVKRVPNVSVMAKLTSQQREDLFASEMTRFELRFGACRRADAAAFWARPEDEVMPVVSWLGVTKAVAERAGEIAAGLQSQGREAKNPIDPLLAATAAVHGLILITRNVRDFERIAGLRIENWFA